jgi:acetylornithine deacetylase/succinyl-diaminopimelate desuccinylase-like protein
VSAATPQFLAERDAPERPVAVLADEERPGRVAVTLELARTHAPLTRDVIVALTAGEETGGSAGVRWLVENHRGASDSLHLRAVGMRAYGVSPGMGSRAEAKAGHGAHEPDERKSVKWLAPGADYFREIVRTLAM